MLGSSPMYAAKPTVLLRGKPCRASCAGCTATFSGQDGPEGWLTQQDGLRWDDAAAQWHHHSAAEG